jgi:hypothetical protein
MKALFKEVSLLLLLMAPVLSLQAANSTVNCSKKTLASEIAKLDKSVPNTVNISGNCIEDIVVSGHADLTLIGAGEASITATAFLPDEDPGNSTTALFVENSKVTVQALTINGGYYGAWCENRSTCIFRNVSVQGGHNGVALQGQSAGDILGSSMIQNSRGVGIGVYGASTVNIRPEPWITLEEVGPVISGHSITECDPEDPDVCGNSGVGAQVLDGSFLRADNATFSGNSVGIDAHRNAVIKLFADDEQHELGGVIDNVEIGISLRVASTASIALPISDNGRADNGGAGIWVGALSFVQNLGVTFSGNNQDVVCQHVTAISSPTGWCGH